MDALSALRLMASPELRQMGLPKGAQDAIAKAIPAGELQTLTPNSLSPSVSSIPSGGGSFESTLGHFVAEIGGHQAAAGEGVSGLLSGQSASLHQTMIAMEEASVSFQLMVEVRNKLLESYQEMMRMQI